MSNIFDTNTLIQVVPNLKRAQSFLLDNFFPNIQTSDSEFVSIDVDVGKRRVAPFCSPLVEGKLVEQRRIQTNTFKPPYIKDKRAPDLLKPVRRMIGERIGGDMDATERMMANLNFEMADQVDMIQRRLEWMAAQALLSGTITVSGEGFDTTVIDFGRDAANTVTLSGVDLWDSGNAAGAQPAEDLQAFATTVMKSSGAKVTDIIFTTKPWNFFRKDQTVKDSLWFPRGGESVIELGNGIEHGALFKGYWGAFRLWLYNDWYVDANDVEQPMIPDGKIILTGPDLMGTRAFASIIDPEFSYTAMPYAPKTWVNKDPAQRFLMMQSAPLVIPSRVNAALSATVTS